MNLVELVISLKRLLIVSNSKFRLRTNSTLFGIVLFSILVHLYLPFFRSIQPISNQATNGSYVKYRMASSKYLNYNMFKWLFGFATVVRGIVIPIAALLLNVAMLHAFRIQLKKKNFLMAGTSTAPLPPQNQAQSK